MALKLKPSLQYEVQSKHLSDKQSMQTCYADEAQSIAGWLVEAYEQGQYAERPQRPSNMRRPHDRARCGACRAGLH